MFVKVSARGQITIPKVLRQALNIHPGAEMVIDVQDKQLILRYPNLFDFVGVIPVDGPLDFDEIRKKAQEHVAQKVMQELENI